MAAGKNKTSQNIMSTYTSRGLQLPKQQYITFLGAPEARVSHPWARVLWSDSKSTYHFTPLTILPIVFHYDQILMLVLLFTTYMISCLMFISLLDNGLHEGKVGVCFFTIISSAHSTMPGTEWSFYKHLLNKSANKPIVLCKSPSLSCRMSKISTNYKDY